MLKSSLIFFSGICFMVYCQEARKELAEKLNKVFVKVETLKPKDMFGVIDAVVTDMKKGVAIDDIPFVDHCLNHLPKDKLNTFSQMQNKIDDCLKKKGRKEKAKDVLADYGKIVCNDLKENYKTIQNKKKENEKKKKSDTEIRTGLYKATNTELAKKLIQKLITKLIAKPACPVWQCVVSNSSSMLSLKNYNTTSSSCKADA